MEIFEDYILPYDLWRFYSTSFIQDLFFGFIGLRSYMDKWKFSLKTIWIIFPKCINKSSTTHYFQFIQHKFETQFSTIALFIFFHVHVFVYYLILVGARGRRPLWSPCVKSRSQNWDPKFWKPCLENHILKFRRPQSWDPKSQKPCPENHNKSWAV